MLEHLTILINVVCVVNVCRTVEEEISVAFARIFASISPSVLLKFFFAIDSLFDVTSLPRLELSRTKKDTR